MKTTARFADPADRRRTLGYYHQAQAVLAAMSDDAPAAVHRLALAPPFSEDPPMPAPDQLVIDIDSVSKIYNGGVQALRDIELRVHPGEVFGLLSPNGAGKSTLVKILMTIVRSSNCKGRMLGSAIGDQSPPVAVGRDRVLDLRESNSESAARIGLRLIGRQT